MATWEISLVSPLEVSTIWTAITQQRIPCSMLKHSWELCALKHLKLGRWEWTGEVTREQSWEESEMQPYSQELMEGLNRKRGGTRLWLALPSVRKSKEIWWAFLEEWAVWAGADITLRFLWNLIRPWITKAILRKKEWSQKYYIIWLQIILQSHNYQNSMVLAEKQTKRVMKQNWEPRSKTT